VTTATIINTYLLKPDEFENKHPTALISALDLGYRPALTFKLTRGLWTTHQL